MRAIILAAGQATRLLPITAYFPKAFLNIGEKMIIEHQLDALVANGVDDITIVIGHLGWMFEKRRDIFDKYDCRIKFIENKEYLETNTLYSLQLALEQDASTTLVLNGDVYCRSEHIKKFIIAGNYAGIDKIRKQGIFSGEEVIVRFEDKYYYNMGYRIEKIGKSTKGRAEAVGIYRIESEFAEELLKVMRWESMSKTSYYETAMYRVLFNYSMYTKLIPGTIEIDTEMDLQKANLLHKEK